MTKRERVDAALAGRPVDRPPIAFWRHVPEIDHDPDRLADSMLAFHVRWDLDLVKIMSSGVYCVEDWGCEVGYTGSPNGAKRCVRHAIAAPADWRRIVPRDPGSGALGRELRAVRKIAERCADDAPVLHTVFSPLTIARKLAGDALADHLRDAPDAVLAALDAIADTMARYVRAALGAGADGLFFATQTATADVLDADDYERFEAPFAERVLRAVPPGAIVILHAHGGAVHFDRIATLPARALNWHDRAAGPSLSDGARRAGRAVVGGLDEWRTLRTGSPDAVADEVRDAVRQTAGHGLVVAPGCVLPLDVPDANLDAAVRAARAARLEVP